ncbi:MAG: hypothetical protein LH468_07745 [Nocardioides sp.]|nr:hypothetical protein [Nocardioides sp.]
MRPTTAVLSATALLGSGLGLLGGTAVDGTAARKAATTRHLDLPDGFQPEGITIGREPRRASQSEKRTRDVAYLGSRVDGDIVRLDLTNKKLTIISQAVGRAQGRRPRPALRRRWQWWRRADRRRAHR